MHRGLLSLSTSARYKLKYSSFDILIIFIFIQAISVAFGLIFPEKFPFTSDINISTALEALPLIGIVALGVGILMITGEFDLSVGANFVFSSMTMAVLYSKEWPLWISILAALISGLILGGLNGIATLWLRIPSFIATLGTTGIYFAGTLFFYGAAAEPFEPTGEYSFVITGSFGVLSVEFFWMVILFSLGWVILQHRPLGGKFMAVGGNLQSSISIGINVRKTKMIAFIMCGVLASISGILAAARVNNVSPGGASDLALQAIAACVIGGISLFGGKGSILGIFIGSALLYWIQDVLLLLGAPGFYLSAFIGAMIISAAYFYRFTRERKIK